MAADLYSPLSSASSIRVLILHPHDPDIDDGGVSIEGDHGVLRGLLVELDIRAATYEVVSYTWGDAGTTETVYVNGQRINVRKNLHDCLRQLRRRFSPRFLWIDAICISQTDLDEKAQQVSMIGAIFATATRVIAWLGERADNSEVLFRRWPPEQMPSDMELKFGEGDSANDFLPIRRPKSPEEVDRLADIWIAFLQRPYWTRTWIVQELVLGKQVTLYCGADKADWRKFFAARFEILTRHSSFDNIELNEPAEKDAASKLSPEKVSKLRDLLEPVHDLRVMRKIYQSPQIGLRNDHMHLEKNGFVYGGGLLYNLLQLFRGRKCFDRRDKVYALQWLIDNARGNFLLHTTGVSEHEPQVDTYKIQPDYRIGMEELFLKVYAAAHAVLQMTEKRGIFWDISRKTAPGEIARVPLILGIIENLELTTVELGRAMNLLSTKVSVEWSRGKDFVLPFIHALRSLVGEEDFQIEAMMRDRTRADLDDKWPGSLKLAMMEKALTELSVTGEESPNLQQESARLKRTILETFARNGSDTPDGEHGQCSNALQVASYEGFEQVAQVLIENGAQVNRQGWLFGNALQAASWAGHEKVVKKLLDAEADVNAQGGLYDNALQAATFKGHQGVVEMLLNHGAIVNAHGGGSHPPLPAALGQKQKEVIGLLLQHGTSPSDSAVILTDRLLTEQNHAAQQHYFYHLSRCLIFLNLIKDARFCCSQHSARCTICDSAITGQCFVCTSCGIVDVCVVCQEANRRGRALPSCRNHEFLSVNHPPSVEDVVSENSNTLSEQTRRWLGDLNHRLKSSSQRERDPRRPPIAAKPAHLKAMAFSSQEFRNSIRRQ